jgi:hypothetical protein
MGIMVANIDLGMGIMTVDIRVKTLAVNIGDSWV